MPFIVFIILFVVFIAASIYCMFLVEEGKKGSSAFLISFIILLVLDVVVFACTYEEPVEDEYIKKVEAIKEAQQELEIFYIKHPEFKENGYDNQDN